MIFGNLWEIKCKYAKFMDQNANVTKELHSKQIWEKYVPKKQIWEGSWHNANMTNYGLTHREN